MFTIEINDAEVIAALTGLQELLDDLSPVMEEIGELLVRSTKDRFLQGEAPDGSKWPGKSKATLNIYARMNRRIDPRPLFQEGRLAGQIFAVPGPTGLVIASNVEYAAAMQFGAVKGSLGAYFYTTKKGRKVDGSSPWGSIPARPFLGLSAEDRTGIHDIVAEWLERVAGGDPR